MLLEEIIVKPLITEKSSEFAQVYNRYGFMVNIKANKNQIKRAVESLYGVKVLNIKTNIRPGKLKKIGRTIKKRSKTKRAFVQLAKGQKMKFFDGV